MSEPLWRPSAEAIAHANLTRFAGKLGYTPPDYRSLHAFSVENRAEFWDSVWRFCGIVGDRGPGPALVDGDRFPGSRWFPEARLNFAEKIQWRSYRCWRTVDVEP
ncbi:MAG: hypothetical protein J4F45_06945 [Pseudomonadales bacterium]|nr:hypothetical protein [Pseudomonadales bacterium]